MDDWLNAKWMGSWMGALDGNSGWGLWMGLMEKTHGQGSPNWIRGLNWWWNRDGTHGKDSQIGFTKQDSWTKLMDDTEMGLMEKTHRQGSPNWIRGLNWWMTQRWDSWMGLSDRVYWSGLMDYTHGRDTRIGIMDESHGQGLPKWTWSLAVYKKMEAGRPAWEWG